MGVFQKITLRGPSASILWGYRTAAALGTWHVYKRANEKTNRWQWTLVASLGHQVNRYELRQTPLLFTAPRRGGFWCWPVIALDVGDTKLRAELGPPEQ